MPRDAATNNGGARPGAGRPKGVLNKRAQVNVKAYAKEGFLPLDYMLALMRDPKVEPTRRDAMAVQAAPYIHPRLGAVLNAGNTGKGGDIDVSVQVLTVPRGATIDTAAGTVTIEGEAVKELPTLTPYEPTPAFTELPAPTHAEPLPVVEVDTSNVTRLERKRAE